MVRWSRDGAAVLKGLGSSSIETTEEALAVAVEVVRRPTNAGLLLPGLEAGAVECSAAGRGPTDRADELAARETAKVPITLSDRATILCMCLFSIFVGWK